MARIVPLPTKKRLKSLDEFEPPAWTRAPRGQRPVAFGLLFASALAAGALGGLWLPI